jgi:putative SOS response-associated peptidase YedK
MQIGVAGTVFLELTPGAQAQGGLFDAPDSPASKARMRAVDALNRRYGRDTVTFAASGRRRGWKLRSAFLSPRLYDELGRAAAGLTMCNDFGNNVPYSAYLEAFSQIRVPVVFPTAAPNLEPRDDIRPTESAPVFRRREEGVELVQLRWGFPPARPKGAPVINFRSEGRRFPKGRCLIPASHFFEFTGSKSPKSKWKFTKVGEDWFCFAGLWRPMPDGAGEAFTLLTTEPGPDVAPIHNRQMVVLDRPDWLAWLELSRPEAELLRPLPAGSLMVEQVR